MGLTTKVRQIIKAIKRKKQKSHALCPFMPIFDSVYAYLFHKSIRPFPKKDGCFFRKNTPLFLTI